MNHIHHLDQLQAFLKDVAPVMKSYYDKLREAGFDQQQAYDLTRDFHEIFFMNRSR